VSDFSNAPYDRMSYQHINSVGRQWIYRYGLASAKEVLGAIRGKYQSIPIPNAEVTLNSADLISAGQQEKQQLIEELKLILESTTRQKMLEAKRAEAENLNAVLTQSPLKFYIG